MLVLVGLGLLAMLGILGAVAASSLQGAARSALQERLLLANAVADRLDSVLADNLSALAQVEGDTEGLRRLAHHSIFTGGVFRTDAQGRIVDSEPQRSPGSAPPMEPVLKALRDKRPVISPHHLRDVWGRAVVSLLVPLPRGQGLLGGEIDLQGSSLRDVLHTLEFGATGYADVVDAGGTVLASTRPQRVLAETDHEQVMASLINERRATVASCHGCHEAEARVREVMAFAPLSRARWAVVVRQEESEALGPVTSMREGFLAAGLLLGALALGVAWAAAQSVTRPVDRLTKAARDIAEGRLDDPLPDLGADEVGRLGAAFDGMRVRLRESRDRIEEWNRDLEDRVRERTRLLEESEARRRELLRKVIGAQEEERRRVARELHDATSQELAALVVGLESSGSEDMKKVAMRALEGVQRLMLDLRPSLLDDLGLEAALRWYAENTLEPRGIAVVFETTGVPHRLPPEVETAVFRAAQEAITNVARHSGAENVLVDLACTEQSVAVEVEDDGAGFDPQEFEAGPDGTRGLGLLGMKERVELLNGTLRVRSGPESGTHIRLEVPLT